VKTIFGLFAIVMLLLAFDVPVTNTRALAASARCAAHCDAWCAKNVKYKTPAACSAWCQANHCS
jgi:hypothetical protein